MSDTAPGGDAAARHADRYGSAPPARRRGLAIALGVGVLAAGVGVAYLGFQKYGPDEINAEQLGYTVVDDSTLSVRVKVSRDDPAKPVVCFVRAMDRDGAEVGRREVLVEASDSGTVQFTTTVRASSRPAAGSVYGCSDRVPAYLRAP
ncbi:DUF4307 domain-containing protein [Nocardia puris]|uniref:Uncharacterized protein DUF4307 n=1 Tax=Nocardia puris TaxID=208602 RepID=A0A366DTE2_9NOCA|nr:DUF4307 domain-containing protein [Nocardia puris]MBF6210751.1 DUF4307 domain-containing protein [Nocardia puris]MBF6364347.1 DUF4307 domain-containing protein [Nocardia puris]MBF6459276.1 DUF4307 domain-containing protein [Nocardia puris]RBO92769.1 uncharacterized protein DUF4307 [Nocardia puris]